MVSLPLLAIIRSLRKTSFRVQSGSFHIPPERIWVVNTAHPGLLPSFRVTARLYDP